jgi:TIR domain-containing protein
MADIFISYKSSDRPRAETLRGWFEAAGRTVWIDRETEIGEGWEKIEKELASSRVVVVIWGAEARRSKWVVREATTALEDGRLIQIHATGLSLPPPFDSIQGARMQAWSGEASHSEKNRLMSAVARKLGVAPPEPEAKGDEASSAAIELDLAGLAELVFFYCVRRLEFQRRNIANEAIPQSLLEDSRVAFDSILERIRPVSVGTPADDREGLFHLMIEGFHEQLELLAPDPKLLK